MTIPSQELATAENVQNNQADPEAGAVAVEVTDVDKVVITNS